LALQKCLKIERTEASETTNQKIKEAKEKYSIAMDIFKI
jgi:hypothetical protein